MWELIAPIVASPIIGILAAPIEVQAVFIMLAGCLVVSTIIKNL